MDESNGLHSDKYEVSFLNCVYYSIVTFTTLGYGDIYPLGFSKVLSSLEVLLGVSYFGLVVSKLTAAKSDYILHRLYSSEVHKRLLEFQISISQFSNNLNSSIGNTDMNLKQDFIDNELLGIGDVNFYEKLVSIIIGMRKYIGYEVYYGEIFQDISRRSLFRVLNSGRDQIALFFKIDKEYDLVLNEKNKKRLEKIMKSYYHTAYIVNRYWKDESTQIKCKEIMRLAYKFNQEILKFDSIKLPQDIKI